MIRAIVFDFDGVLVESVDVKTRAFGRVFADETPEAVQQIIQYHLKNGGISRFEKFRTIYRDILKRPLPDHEFRSLCDRFASLVVDEIVAAPWVEGGREFLLRNAGQYECFIVSGTPEGELREIVRRRSMEGYFREILGSPPPKDVLLHDAMQRHGLRPADLVFVGDAESDWMAARETGVRFIWRRSGGDAPDLVGFMGPCIPSMVALEECLAALEHVGARNG